MVTYELAWDQTFKDVPFHSYQKKRASVEANAVEQLFATKFTQYVSKAQLQIWKVVVNLDLRTGAERLD